MSQIKKRVWARPNYDFLPTGFEVTMYLGTQDTTTPKV
jgi:coenzyme PQQ precursor peptide PqqA